MRELVTYIDEGFYQTTGAHDAVIQAKIFKLFDDGDLVSYLRKLGCSKTSFVAGVFKLYLVRSLQKENKDHLLNGLVMAYNRQGNHLIYLSNKELDEWEKGKGPYKDRYAISDIYNMCTFTQDMSVVSVKELRNLRGKISKTRLSDLTVTRLSTLAISWIQNNTDISDDQWVIYPYTEGSKCCSFDLEQVLEATGIDYQKVNLSRTGTGKTGDVFILDSFSKRFK